VGLHFIYVFFFIEIVANVSANSKKLLPVYLFIYNIIFKKVAKTLERGRTTSKPQHVTAPAPPQWRGLDCVSGSRNNEHPAKNELENFWSYHFAMYWKQPFPNWNIELASFYQF
jgi:hypothetical protein